VLGGGLLESNTIAGTQDKDITKPRHLGGKLRAF
jgi:hypothetical protein